MFKPTPNPPETDAVSPYESADSNKLIGIDTVSTKQRDSQPKFLGLFGD